MRHFQYVILVTQSYCNVLNEDFLKCSEILTTNKHFLCVKWNVGQSCLRFITSKWRKKINDTMSVLRVRLYIQLCRSMKHVCMNNVSFGIHEKRQQIKSDAQFSRDEFLIIWQVSEERYRQYSQLTRNGFYIDKTINTHITHFM